LLYPYQETTTERNQIILIMVLSAVSIICSIIMVGKIFMLFVDDKQGAKKGCCAKIGACTSAGGKTTTSCCFPLLPITWVFFPLWFLRAIGAVLYQTPLILLILAFSLMPCGCWMSETNVEVIQNPKLMKKTRSPPQPQQYVQQQQQQQQQFADPRKQRPLSQGEVLASLENTAAQNYSSAGAVGAGEYGHAAVYAPQQYPPQQYPPHHASALSDSRVPPPPLYSPSAHPGSHGRYNTWSSPEDKRTSTIDV